MRVGEYRQKSRMLLLAEPDGVKQLRANRANREAEPTYLALHRSARPRHFRQRATSSARAGSSADERAVERHALAVRRIPGKAGQAPSRSLSCRARARLTGTSVRAGSVS